MTASLLTSKFSARSAATDDLRTFLTIMVVLHHSALAYDSGLRKYLGVYADAAVPVIDRNSSALATIIAGLNDICLMPAMFFISGLFVLPGLMRTGAASYLKRRFLRLGVPLVVMTLFLSPLAFYIGSLSKGNVSTFWTEWAVGFQRLVWPVGPAWFLSVLLIFDIIAARYFRKIAWTNLAGLFRSAPISFVILSLISFLVYFGVSLFVSPYTWVGVGPIAVQASRAPVYALYFFTGVSISFLPGTGIRTSMFGLDHGRAAVVWGVALFCAAICIYLIQTGYVPLTRDALLASASLDMAKAIICCAMLFLLQKWAARLEETTRNPLRHLQKEAFGIYCLHYPVVVYVQYVIYRIEAPGILKMLFVFTVSLALSWALARLLRLNSFIRSVI